MLGTRILQFNCGLANYKTTRPILDAADPNTHQVLAIQEQAYNRYTATTHCPWGYSLASNSDPAAKVCFMVSKKIPAHTWSLQSLGQYVGTLQMQMNDVEMTITNVYNSRGNGPRIQTWNTIQRALCVAKGKILLLGDFNAHHPS